MKIYPLAFLSLATLSSCSYFLPSHSDKGEIAATVNGKPVSKVELDILQSISAKNGIVDSKTILNEIIQKELLSQEALKNGLDRSTEAQLDNARRFVLAQAAVRHFSGQQQVSDTELKQAYEQEIVPTSIEIHAQHILLENESDAQDIITRLGKGENIGALATSLSKDPTARINRGDIGWFKPEKLVKEFSTAALALKDGETSSIPVHSPFGWHIIHRIESRSIDPPPFDQVKESLKNMIIDKRLQQHIETLKANAKIVNFTK